MTSFAYKMTEQWQRWHKLWPLLLAAVYLTLPLVIDSLFIGLGHVQGVSYLLFASAAGTLLVWAVRYPPGRRGFLGTGKGFLKGIDDWRLGRESTGRQHTNPEPPPSGTASLPAWERPPSRAVSLLAPLDIAVDALRRVPSVVLWLPLPVSLSWVAGMMAREVFQDRDGFYLAFALWLVALILFVAIFLVPRVVENWGKLPTLVRAMPWREVGAVAFITVSAFTVRFVFLADEPDPFWQDEGGFSSLGLEVARGIRTNFFFMGFDSLVSDVYELTIGISFKLLGVGILSARLPQAIVGTITVPLFYLMLREMFDRRVALVGAAFLAVYHFHVHFSRIAFPNLYDTFWAVLVLLFAFRAIRTQRLLDFALAGLAAGLQFYFFSGARLLPLVLVILLVYMALKTRGAFVLRNFWGLGVLVSGFVIASLPAALYWDGNRGHLTSRFNNQNIFDTGWLDEQVALTGRSELHVLWDQFQHSLGALVVYDEVFQHYAAGIPLLTGIGSVFFVIGGVYALFHIYQPRFFVLFVLLLLVVIFGGALLGPPVASQRYLGTVVVSGAFVAVGVVVAAEALAKVVPRWRTFAPVAAGAAVLLIAFVNLNFYFGDYLPSERYGLARHYGAAQVADYLEGFDDSYTVYFFGVAGFTTNDHGMLFRQRDKIFVEVFPDGVMFTTFVEAVRHALGEAAAAAREGRPNALFLVPTERVTELMDIQEECPNGVRSEVITTPNGLTEYQWYEVPGAQECVDSLQRIGILKEL